MLVLLWICATTTVRVFCVFAFVAKFIFLMYILYVYVKVFVMLLFLMLLYSVLWLYIGIKCLKLRMLMCERFRLSVKILYVSWFMFLYVLGVGVIRILYCEIFFSVFGMLGLGWNDILCVVVCGSVWCVFWWRVWWGETRGIDAREVDIN